MIRGRVVGAVWASRKVAALDGRSLKLCALQEGDGLSDRIVVAIDTLDAHANQDVLISFGSGARNILQSGPDNRAILCDAAVSLIVEGESTCS